MDLTKLISDKVQNIKEISKTQRYKQLGNAVTTVWPKLIAERLFNNE